MVPRHVCMIVVALAMCIAIDTSSIAFSQDDGSGSSRSAPARATRPPTPDEFYASFWNFIIKRGAAYNTWTVLQREKTDDGIENPHSTISKTYVDKNGSADTADFPIGSILVREDYDAERNRQSISVMYRVKDYDKEHGNWYYLRYLEDGSVAKLNGKSVAGRVASCIECHTNAKGQDFVFSNDAIQPGTPADNEKKLKDDEPKE